MKTCAFCGLFWRCSDRTTVYCSAACSRKARIAASMFTFWNTINRAGTCWLWTGRLDNKGYAKLYYDGCAVFGSRLMFRLVHGRWPQPCALHHCDTPACVHPLCIFEGTRADNNADRVAKGRSSKGDRHYSRTRPEQLPRGESHGRSKLTEADVREARTLRAQGWKWIPLAQRYGVAHHAIQLAVSGKTWSHVV